MIKNFYINGLQVNDSRTFLSSINGGAGAKVEFNSYARGGKDGQVLSNPKKSGFAVSLKFAIFGRTLAEYYQKYDRLIGLLQNPSAEDVRKTIGVERDDGVIKELEVLFGEPVTSLDSSNVAHSEITVSAISEREYAQSKDQKIINVVLKNLGGMAIPMGIPMNMANAPVVTTEYAVNNGNANGYPVVEIHGAFASGFSFLNETTGEQFDYGDELLSTDVLVIDFYTETIIKNGVDNMLQYQDGDFLRLAPGSNKLSISGGTGDSGFAIVTYNDYFANV